MKLETFFEKFDLFADASDAVERMRELVLELAVTGKLVAQDKRDEPATLLLASAKIERTKLVADRQIKARPVSLVEAEERPFEVPATWAWGRLSDVGYELGQKVPDKRFTYIDVGGIDADKGCISERVEKLEPNEAPSRARKLVTRGTVIYSTVRPYLRNIAIVDQDFDPEPIASTAFGILHPFAGINNRYLFHWLRSRPFTVYVGQCMKGMAYPAINDEKFYSGYIPLPPLAEQKRIVAKVDELMSLCDQLEAQQKERETRHAVLARASLARFADAPTPANLQLLFHPSYPIPPADLRKSILALAIQGKLVSQDSDDEPAEAAVVQIENERERLIAAKQFRRSQLPGPIEEGPFDIPETWAWTYLGNAMLNVTDGFHSTPKTIESGVRYVTAKHVKPGLIDFDSCLYVSEEDFMEIASKTRPKKGDVLVVNIGAGCGLASIIEVDFVFAFKNVAILNRPKEVDPKFLFYYLVSRRDHIFEERTKGGAQPFLSLGLIREIPFPLPPLAEQRRIVAKVDELMTLMDALEIQLATARTTAVTLLATAVLELSNGKERHAAAEI